ncbi:MAG: DUF4142 domain-containing protein [Pyrinomonadaceae bacterium]
MIDLIKKQTYRAALLAAFAILASLAQLRIAPLSGARAAAVHQPTDANIAAIVSVAGNLDIAYGKIAIAKSKNPKVLEFAKRMVTDHTAIQNGAETLLGKLGVTPEEDHTSQAIAENGEMVKAKLNSLSGAEFDKFYIDNEVEYHEIVVNATAKVLIPNAQNTELKSTLESVLPLFERHLDHARMIQKSMANTGAMKSEITDANIGAIVTVAGGLDIAYGSIAMKTSKSKMVKEFAKRMVTDHTAVQKAVDQLAGKLGLVPEDNDTSRGLAANGVNVKSKLNSMKGKEFDKYYIDNEVAYHELVVNATRDLLIPNAKNEELKQALIQTLPLFERHLEHARSIQRQMNGGANSSHSMGH